MYLTALSFAIILIGALLAVMGAQQGRKNGLVRSVMNLGSVIVSAVLATFFSDWMSGMFEGASRNLIYNLGFSDSFDSALGDVSSVISMLAEPVAAMFVYIPVFLAFYGICTLVCRYVYKEYCSRGIANRVEYESQEAPFYVRESASLGMACGIVSGILLTVVIMTPVAGGLKTAKKAVNVVQNMSDESVVNGSDLYSLRHYSDDVMLSVVYSTGGSALFDMTTMIKGDNGRVLLRDELDYLEKVDILDVEASIAGAMQGDAAARGKMNDYAEGSAIIGRLSKICFRNACREWRNGSSYLGVASPLTSSNSVFKYLIEQMLNKCDMSYDAEFDKSYQTLMSVVGIINEAQDMVGNDNGYETALKLLTTGNTVDRINEEIVKNESMYYFLSTDYLNEISMNIISNYINHKVYVSGYYSYEYFERMADVYNDSYSGSQESRVAKMRDQYVALFDEMGLKLPSSAIEKMCRTMINYYSYRGYIYYHDIESFFNNYLYSNYNYYLGEINYY